WRSSSPGSPTCCWSSFSAPSRRGRPAGAHRSCRAAWSGRFAPGCAQSPLSGKRDVLLLASNLGQQFADSFKFMANNTGHLLHDTLATLALSGAALGVALAVT